MTIRPIRYLGDPVLRQPAKKVKRVDDYIRRLIFDMTESMIEAQGVGIAAPQIGVNLRIVIIGMPDEHPFPIINPEVIKRNGSRELDEGCLSVPGYHGIVPRSKKVVVKGLDEKGHQIRITAEDDLLAQALEHEVDHVNGTLYVDHLNARDDLIKIDNSSHTLNKEDHSEGRLFINGILIQKFVLDDTFIPISKRKTNISIGKNFTGNMYIFEICYFCQELN